MGMTAAGRAKSLLLLLSSITVAILDKLEMIATLNALFDGHLILPFFSSAVRLFPSFYHSSVPFERRR